MPIKGIIYIIGRGHSGTTVLDAILGNSDHIESVGELVSGLSRWPAEMCSCGKCVDSCQFWQSVTEYYSDHRKSRRYSYEFSEMCNILVSNAKITKLVKVLLNITKKQQSINDSEDLLFDSIYHGSNKQDVYILDSSKEMTRGLALLKRRLDVKLIHLIRDPRSIVSSYRYRLKKGMPFKLFRKQYFPKTYIYPLIYLIIAFTWLIWNASIDLMAIFYPSRILRIKYEDIISSTNTTIDNIAEFIDADLNKLKEDIKNNEYFYVGHNVGGNEMRHLKIFQFKKSISTRRKRTILSDIIVLIICWPLMLKYKYFFNKISL